MWRSAVARRSSLLSSIFHSTITRLPDRLSPNVSLLSSPKFLSQASTGASGIVWSDAKYAGENDVVGGVDEHGRSDMVASEHSSVSCETLENRVDNIDGVARSDEKRTVEIDEEKLKRTVALLKGKVDESLGSSLKEMGLDLSESFVLKLIWQVHPKRNLLHFFKWALRQPGFSITTRILDQLLISVKYFLQKKEAFYLRDVIMEIGEREKGVIDRPILNKLTHLLSRLHTGQAIIDTIDSFGQLGCVQDLRTHMFLLRALCRKRMCDRVLSLCKELLDSGSLPPDETGKVISWLCSRNRAKEALVVYSLAKEKNLLIPQVYVTYLIKSLSRYHDLIPLALGVLDDIPREVRQHSPKPFLHLMQGLCQFREFEEAKSLVSKMIDAGPPPGYVVFHAIISALSGAGEMEEALAMTELMKSRGLKPELHSYVDLLSAYAKRGQMEEAFRVFLETKKEYPNLSRVIYNNIIRGYCRVGNMDDAMKAFNDMKTHGLQPDARLYGRLIQSHCEKALDWKAAEKLQEEMKESGLFLKPMSSVLIKVVKQSAEKELEARKLGLQG